MQVAEDGAGDMKSTLCYPDPPKIMCLFIFSRFCTVQCRLWGTLKAIYDRCQEKGLFLMAAICMATAYLSEYTISYHISGVMSNKVKKYVKHVKPRKKEEKNYFKSNLC